MKLPKINMGPDDGAHAGGAGSASDSSGAANLNTTDGKVVNSAAVLSGNESVDELLNSMKNSKGDVSPGGDELEELETETLEEETLEGDEGEGSEGEEEADLPKGLDPKTQEAVNKRIGKEVGKRKLAEEKATELEAKATTLSTELEEARERIAELESTPHSATTGNDPLSLVESHEQLDTMAEQIVQARLKFRPMIRNGESYTDADGNVSTPEELQNFLDMLEERKEIGIPRARRALDKRLAQEAKAKEIYPEIATPGTALHKKAQALLKQLPQLRTLPNYLTLIGDAIAGEAARSSGGKTTTPAKKVPVIAKPAGKRQPGVKASTAAGTPASKSGGVVDRNKEFREAGYDLRSM